MGNLIRSVRTASGIMTPVHADGRLERVTWKIKYLIPHSSDCSWFWRRLVEYWAALNTILYYTSFRSEVCSYMRRQSSIIIESTASGASLAADTRKFRVSTRKVSTWPHGHSTNSAVSPDMKMFRMMSMHFLRMRCLSCSNKSPFAIFHPYERIYEDEQHNRQ